MVFHQMPYTLSVQLPPNLGSGMASMQRVNPSHLWSVPLKSWTGNKEIEEQRTKPPYQTKSGAEFGGDEIDVALKPLQTPSWS